MKIKNADDEISVSILKVKELEFQNKILEKEEFDAKNETSFMKNVLEIEIMNV